MVLALVAHRQFQVNIALGPNAGPLGRLPVGGRNWEGFSVDPYLSGQLNAETIVGIQDAGVVANIKVRRQRKQGLYRRAADTCS